MSHAGVVAERLQPVASASRARRGVALGALGAALLLGAYGVFALGRRLPPRAAASADANAPEAPVASAPFAPTKSAVVAPVVPAPAASAPVVAAAGTPSPTPAPAPSVKPSTRSGRGAKQPRPGCDPPYTIDSVGREVFKLQCL